jgi:hypothetical protein
MVHLAHKVLQALVVLLLVLKEERDSQFHISRVICMLQCGSP